MLYFFCVSYLISLSFLLKTSDSTHSSKRFWIKLLTCIHPLLILMGAVLTHSIEFIPAALIWALVFALLGDISLGLKHRFKLAMPLGIVFFSFTHLALSILFYEQTWFVWTLILVLTSWTLLFKILSKHLIFGPYTKMIALYGFLILMMFGLATSSTLLNFDVHHLIQWLGALAFLLSDTLLSQKYFAKTKATWIHTSYLILYHFALSLLTLSVFL